MLKLATKLVPIAALAFAGPALAQTQFGSQYTILSGFQMGDIELLDMDQDGDLDVAVCTSPWLIYTLENLGNGQFGPPASLSILNIFQGSRGIQAADLDGDGRDDIVCAAHTSAVVSWWRSQGDGTFSMERRLDSSFNRPTDIATGDIDADGDMDVLCSTQSERVVRFYENLGGGNFAPGVESQGYPGGVFGLTVGLIDSDAFLDVVACSTTNPEVFWARGNGDGTFSTPQSVAQTSGEGARPVVVDVDADGLNDIIATFVTGDSVVWFRSTGSGFEPPRIIDPNAPGAFDLDLADMDLDGDLDLVVAAGTLNRVRTYENLGGGNFGPPGHVHGFKERVWGVKFKDIDGDFDPEIVSGVQGNYTVVVNENLSSLGEIYCGSPPNSAGSRSKINATGSRDASRNQVLLVASDLPPDQTGVFMASMTRGWLTTLTGSQGTMCLDGAVGSFLGPGEIQSSGPAGQIFLRINTQRIPQPAGFVSIASGATWRFQAWHRDSVNGQVVSHFTQAIRVTFI